VFPSHVRRTFTRHPADYTGELVRLLDDIATLTHGISSYMIESDDKFTYGQPGQNPITSSFVTRQLYRSLSNDGYACLILAKDTEDPLTFPEDVPHGGYVVCVCPLDTDPMSTHQTSAGTSFSIYKRKSSASLPGRYIDLQQKLSEQVAAGFCIYSSAITLTYTMGYGLFSFVMHPVAVQYFLQPTNQIMLDPVPSCVYASRAFLKGDSPLAKSLAAFVISKNLKTVQAGSLLVNFAMLIQNGGILAAEGVHLLCEAAPLALLVEQAGGTAINDKGERILDLSSGEDAHQTITICCGLKESIAEIVAAMKSM